jgi:hypothetical protein
MVFIPRRVGGGLSQGTGMRTGISGIKKTTGTGIGSQSHSGAFSRTQGIKKTDVSNGKKWGFYDALVGQRNQQNDRADKPGVIAKKSFTDKLSGVKYEVVSDSGRVGADGVRYKSTGYKKGKILIDKSMLDDGVRGRKNFAKAIGKLSKRGSLNKVTGKLSSGSGGFARDFSERNISKVNRRSERSGKSFSKGTMKDLLK